MGSVAFIDHDCSSKMNEEVSDNLQRNSSKIIRRIFIMWQDNNPKHTTTSTKDFSRIHNDHALKNLKTPTNLTTT